MKSFTPPAKGTVNHDLEGQMWLRPPFYNRKKLNMTVPKSLETVGVSCNKLDPHFFRWAVNKGPWLFATQLIGITHPKRTCPLKPSGWKMPFLMTWSILRGHVSFQGCELYKPLGRIRGQKINRRTSTRWSSNVALWGLSSSSCLPRASPLVSMMLQVSRRDFRTLTECIRWKTEALHVHVCVCGWF